jgi:exopolysaccharide biosynthesis protein
MTLDELGAFMAGLGCQEALNFDGGGSATLWFEGEVRNSPCDRAEREIANCLVIAKRKTPAGTPGSNHQ